MRRKGFTLIQWIVAITVVAVLCAGLFGICKRVQYVSDRNHSEKMAVVDSYRHHFPIEVGEKLAQLETPEYSLVLEARESYSMPEKEMMKFCRDVDTSIDREYKINRNSLFHELTLHRINVNVIVTVDKESYAIGDNQRLVFDSSDTSGWVRLEYPKIMIDDIELSYNVVSEMLVNRDSIDLAKVNVEKEGSLTQTDPDDSP